MAGKTAAAEKAARELADQKGWVRCQECSDAKGVGIYHAPGNHIRDLDRATERNTARLPDRNLSR